MSMDNPQYEKSKPAQPDSFADWQYNIQTNFNLLAQVFANNHIGLYSAIQPSTTEQGKHTYVQLFSGDVPQTEISENNIYTQLDINNASQIFMAMQNNQADFQYSAYQTFSIGNTFTASLPGNFWFAFGIFPYSSDPPSIIALPTTISSLSYCSVTPLASAVVNSLNYFYVQLVDVGTTGQKGINVVWNGPGTPPSSYYYMIIAKWKEVE